MSYLSAATSSSMGRMTLRIARLRKPAIEAHTTSPIVPVAWSAATFGKYSGWIGRISWTTFRFGYLALKAGMNLSSCHFASSLLRKWTLTSPVACFGAAAGAAAAGAVVEAAWAAGSAGFAASAGFDSAGLAGADVAAGAGGGLPQAASTTATAEVPVSARRCRRESVRRCMVFLLASR